MFYICQMKKIDIDKLITVKNYATSVNKTTQYIYLLIKNGKLKSTIIDGKVFVLK